MTYNETEILIKKYLNGETTAEEERRLALEVSREDVPDDWKIIAGMLGELTVDEVLFDQMMAERRQKARIIKLWPWLAAACVAALLMAFLGPPREDVSTQPQTAKVEPLKPQPVQVDHGDSSNDPISCGNGITQNRPHDTSHRKARNNRSVPKQMAKEVPAPENSHNELTKVDESDIVPYEDPLIQFAEQAKELRERGNRVIQRVSMNSLPQNGNPLYDI